MIAPQWAVTAAHCLGVRVLGHVAPISAIHLLLGYRDGAFTRHAVPDSVHLAEDTAADAALPNMGGHRGRDIALLHFAERSLDTLTPDTAALEPGTSVSLGGYSQDRAERLAIDPGCAVLGYGPDRDRLPVLLHDCAGTHGSSGGAVLRQDAGGWHLVGVQVAGRSGGAGGEAVPGFAVAQLLATVAPSATP